MVNRNQGAVGALDEGQVLQELKRFQEAANQPTSREMTLTERVMQLTQENLQMQKAFEEYIKHTHNRLAQLENKVG
jgi:hypothetical protein